MAGQWAPGPTCLPPSPAEALQGIFISCPVDSGRDSNPAPCAPEPSPQAFILCCIEWCYFYPAHSDHGIPSLLSDLLTSPALQFFLFLFLSSSSSSFFCHTWLFHTITICSRFYFECCLSINEYFLSMFFMLGEFPSTADKRVLF